MDVMDIIGEIMTHLSRKDLYNFSIVNNLTHRAYETHLRLRFSTYRKGHKFKLHIRQMIALTFLENHTERDVTISAPPSFGKTLVGLYRAFSLVEKVEGYVLISVPSKTLTTWVKEVNSFFPKFYKKQNAQESTFLIYNSTTHKNHTKYIRDSLQTGIKGKIIVCTLMNRMFRILSHRSKYMIVDEAQVGSWYHRTALPHNHPILSLTADTSYKHPRKNGMKVSFPFTTKFTSELPTVGYKCDILSWEDCKHDMKTVVLANNKTVLFTSSSAQFKPKTQEHKELSVWCKAKNIKLFRFVNAISSIERFKKHTGKGLLLANIRTATEGVNMIGDAMIVLDPLHVKTSRLFQCTSRLIRTTNPYKEIHCSFMESIKDDFKPYIHLSMHVKVKMLEERAYINRFREVNIHMLGWRLQILKQKGYELKELSITDIYILGTVGYTSGVSSVSKYAKNHNYKPKTLSLEVLREIINESVDLV